METHGEAIVVTSPEDLRNKLDAAFADPVRSGEPTACPVATRQQIIFQRS